MQNPIDITFASLTNANTEQFYDLVNDDDVKKYFDSFNGDREEILSKLININENPSKQYYWGIFNQEGFLFGFISLKATPSLLPPKEQDLDTLMNMTDDDKEEQNAYRLSIAPFSVDFVTHRNFRKCGIARQAIQFIKSYAGEPGLKHLYFEIHLDNQPSHGLMRKINAVEVNASDSLFYPSKSYRLYLKETDEELNIFLTSRSDNNRKGYNMTRQFISSMPVYFQYRKILIELFELVLTKKVIIAFDEANEYCKLRTDCFDTTLIIGTKPREDIKTMIWSLAHEYGHLLQGKPREKQKKRYTKEKFDREAEAWDLAEEWLKSKPLYLFQWQNFIRMRNSRLESYLPK
ncbi:MAG: GNAT family N-acetyltransferase [Chryseobacterium sp.]|nr:MAG: GNAT family N-acetyltransferase [Chryseobacterium sp.]